MIRSFNRYLSISEERQLLNHVKQFADVLAQRDHAWMRLLRQTGVRVGALSQLTVWDARQALVNGNLLLRADIQKTDVDHSVFINRKARQALLDLLRLRKTMGHAEHPEAPLIMSRNHRAMSVRSFQHRMQKWRESAGLPVDASPHWFRHTLAKRIMKNSTAEDPRGVVKVVLGHAEWSSTAVYTQPDKEDIQGVMEEIA